MKYVYNCYLRQIFVLIPPHFSTNFLIHNQNARRNRKRVHCAHQGWQRCVVPLRLAFWLKKICLLEIFGAFDAWVLAIHNDQIITLPNCDFVPKPFIFDDHCIESLCDGRFGHVDCFQWLQLHAEPYIWSTCVPRQVAYWGDPMCSLLWWNISWSPTEFILELGSTFKVGWIHSLKFQQLEGVYECLDERAQKWMKQNPHYN